LEISLLREIAGYVFGPHGGSFAGGVSIGAYGVIRFLFPRWLANELKAQKIEIELLKSQVADLKAELQPYKEWQNERIKETLNARKS